MRTDTRWTIALAAVAFVACGGGGAGVQDVVPIDPGPYPDVQNSDLSGDSTNPGDVGDRDIGGEDLAAIDVPVADEGPPEPGEFGYPCTDNVQCHSGFCLDSPQGRICTRTCVENCPTDWVCKNITVTGETVSICVPLFLNLCDPCGITKDCNGELTGGTAICIDRGGDGKFCGADCTGTDKCPAGYECVDKEDGAGGLARQCVPVSDGQCQCSPRAISLGLNTECFKTGTVGDVPGLCKGVRRCLLDGLTACDARTPHAEDCNNIDDDCNGLTDELQGKFPCNRSNSEGTCIGAGDCVDGVIQNCDARTPKSESEFGCNNVDDNCDGQTDEGLCYDGNPCTKDLCDAGSGTCVFEPFAGPCDDLNPCTVNDHCDENGNCLAGSQKNCDDNNPCTDDGCDTGTGNCLHLANTSPCEDGNPCTVNDYCSTSVCRAGPAKSCPEDGNPCTNNEHCDSKSGMCVSSPANGIPCDDGNGCTINDTCSGGSCVGPGNWCDTQTLTCVPVPPKTICISPKCLELPIIGPQCTCVCI